MNLVTGNWIPVILEDGSRRLVSLKALYEQADEISDLVLNPPPEDFNYEIVGLHYTSGIGCF